MIQEYFLRYSYNLSLLCVQHENWTRSNGNPIFIYAGGQKMEIFQAADEPGGLLRDHPLCSRPRHRRSTGQNPFP